MKGTSEVILGATLIMVATLGVVLVLIFVLLAELYCSLLLHRRRHRNSSSSTIPTAATQTTTTRENASPSPTSDPQEQSPPPPLLPFSIIYGQGVLQAPRNILLPAVSSKVDIAEPKMQHYSELQTQTQESNASPCQVELLYAHSPSPKPIHEDQDPLPGSNSGRSLYAGKACSGGEHLVYISNPIYENDESLDSGVTNTPFVTPDTSPSRLERSGSSGEDEATEADQVSPCGNGGTTHSPPPYTPPMTPMKKLPAEACSVSLRDARSLGTSGSDSRSNNALSSSSSGSPCTSPSW